jgi:hypothetical protein
MEDTESLTFRTDEVPPELDREAYSEEGVDLTLIRWMLFLSPTERLKVLQQNVQSLARLCNEGTLS